MSKPKPFKDPRGHSLRIYSDIFDSAAFKALGPHDVMAYLALLRELKGSNNGDLSLTLSRATTCGISHPKTLARSLRALCAVGLVAVTRKGGCTKGGQRLPSLYRVTDRECYQIPAKHLQAIPATNEWKEITSAQHGKELIAQADAAVKKDAAKLKPLGHFVTPTMAPSATIRPITRALGEPWNAGLGHLVNMAEKGSNPMPMRASGEFSHSPEIQSHRALRSTPLYIANHGEEISAAEPEESARGPLQFAVTSLADLWAKVGSRSTWDGQHVGIRPGPRTNRLAVAKAAMCSAQAKHAPSAPPPQDTPTRIQDEHAHDLSVWND